MFVGNVFDFLEKGLGTLAQDRRGYRRLSGPGGPDSVLSHHRAALCHGSAPFRGSPEYQRWPQDSMDRLPGTGEGNGWGEAPALGEKKRRNPRFIFPAGIRFPY